MRLYNYSVCEVQYTTKRCNFASILSYVGPTHKSCTEITSIPTTSSTGSTSTINSHLTDASTEHPPTDSSTESPKGTTAPVPTAQPPSKVAGVHVTSNTGVQNTSPTLTVTWHALASGAVTYTVKYSTQPGEVNTPPEGAFEVTGISGTSTILTALERGTTYYIWVVWVSGGGEGLHSDKTSGVTYKS